MPIPVQREVMCIIERFVEEAPPGKSPWTKENIFLSFVFFSWRNTQDQDIPYGSK